MDFPEQLQVLRTKQQKLWDEGFDKFIKFVRCKNELCKDVPDKEKAERQQAVDETTNEIGNLEIAIQVLRDSFYEEKK